MQPCDAFRFCPACAAPRPDGTAASPLVCIARGFTFHFSAAIAAAAFVQRADGRILLIRRARDPAGARPLEDVEAITWRHPVNEVAPADLAFPSMQAALGVLRQRLAAPGGGPALPALPTRPPEPGTVAPPPSS